MSNDYNPYGEDDETGPLLELCGVNWPTSKTPVVNYGSLIYSFPPIGQVRVRGRANARETGIQGKKIKASKIELQGFESSMVSFEIDLITDEDGIAVEKYAEMYTQFRSLDSKNRNQLFALSYPTAADIQLVYFDEFEVEDNPGEDRLRVRCTLKEITQLQSAVSFGASEGGGGGGTGAGGAGAGGSSGSGGSGGGESFWEQIDAAYDKGKGSVYRQSEQEEAGLKDN